MKKIVIALICISVLLTLSVGATNVRGDVDQNGSLTVVDVLQIVRSLLNKVPLQGSDVNRDGKINVADVTAIQRYLASYITLDAEQMIIADTNFDGEVNIKDATQIQRYLAGYITGFYKK